MSLNPVHLTAEQLKSEITELRNQIIQSESQFQSAAEEHQDVLIKLDNLRELLAANSKNNAYLLKAELYEKISILQSGSASNGSVVDSSNSAVKQIFRVPTFEDKAIVFNRWINGITEIFENYPMLKDFQNRALVEALNRQYGSLVLTDLALERIDTLKLTMNSDFNTSRSRIRKYVLKVANESFEEHKMRLKAHMHNSQAKLTYYSSRSNNMDIDVISAPIQVENNYAIAAAQYSSFNRHRQPANNYQKNPFQRSRQFYNRENTTMTKEQFDEYVKKSICFFVVLKAISEARALSRANYLEQWIPNYKKTSEPPDKNNYTIFALQLPLQLMPTDSIKPTSLNTLNLHLNEDICFKLTAKINSLPVTVVIDSGSQIAACLNPPQYD
ncbi:hypothetical protein BB561_001667 [Smittium simulii]|uniref:Uncharacterized protein n=1 Tax=Smittium simulii TaxID=133385 RepID=A0A2T9YTQ4_9FUNG|nr:hypothetical protein BB561_001667 [Smittium simulii]